MYQRMRLYWQDPTDEELEAEWIEEEFREHMRLLHKYAGNCPLCGTALSIGVGDYTAGRTCDNCGYHDFSFLHPEIELWEPSLWKRVKSRIINSTRRLTTTVARALVKFSNRGTKHE